MTKGQERRTCRATPETTSLRVRKRGLWDPLLQVRDFTPKPSPGQGQAVPGLVCIRCGRSQRKARGGKKCLLPICQKRSHLLGWEKGDKEDEQRGQERGQPPPSTGSSGNPDLSLPL